MHADHPAKKIGPRWIKWAIAKVPVLHVLADSFDGPRQNRAVRPGIKQPILDSPGSAARTAPIRKANQIDIC